MKDLIQWDRKLWRIWILRQRVHHGPVGLSTGLMLLLTGIEEWQSLGVILMAWGLTDLHDRSQWFIKGAQE